jgi:pyruvate dehydrogenase E1 component beta subunit
VEEACSVSISEVSARIMEKVFYDLDVPVQRLCGAEVPIPYANHLEEAAIPQVNDIINTVKKIIHHD